MSKEKESNFLYSFELKKTVEKDIEEQREENGETVTITKKKKQKVPVKFYLKNPSRRERERADMYYAESFGKAVEAGVIPRALLDKKFKDSGGELNNKERGDYDELIMKLVEGENEITSLSMDKEKNIRKINKLGKELVLVRKKLVNIQTYTNILYKDTADSKAESKTIVWLLLHLMYWKNHESEDIVPLFPGKELEDKLEFYDDFYDQEDEFMQSAIEKMLSHTTLLYMGAAKSRKDFEYYEEEMNKGNLS